MKQTHLSNRQSYAFGCRMASLVFLGLSASLLIISAVLRFFMLDNGIDSPLNRINSYQIQEMVIFFSVFGFIFFIVFAWFTLLNLFFSKGAAAHRVLFVTSNCIVLIGILMIISGSFFNPSYNILDLLFISNLNYVFKVTALNSILIVLQIIAYATVIFGFALMIFSLIDQTTRDPRLFGDAIIVFVIATILLLSSAVLYIYDDFATVIPQYNDMLLAPKESSASLNVIEAIYSIMSTFGFVSIFVAFILLITSGSKSLGIRKGAFTLNVIAFALMSCNAIIFAIYFAITDLNASIISPSSSMSFDLWYYWIYGLFLACAVLSASQVLSCFGATASWSRKSLNK